VGGAVSRQAGGAKAKRRQLCEARAAGAVPRHDDGKPDRDWWAKSSANRWDCQGMNRVSWMAMAISVEKHRFTPF